MSPSPNSNRRADGRDDSRVSLNEMVDCFSQVARRIEYEDRTGTSGVGSLIEFSGRNNVRIIFSTNLGEVNITQVIANLNSLKDLLDNLDCGRRDITLRIRKDCWENAQYAKKIASSAETTSKNPRNAIVTQEFLIDLAGALSQVCADIVKLQSDRASILNWSNFIKDV